MSFYGSQTGRRVERLHDWLFKVTGTAACPPAAVPSGAQPSAPLQPPLAAPCSPPHAAAARALRSGACLGQPPSAITILFLRLLRYRLTHLLLMHICKILFVTYI